MKKLYLLLFISISFVHAAFSQLQAVKKNVYPISDKDSLIGYYFPLKLNMENPKSPFHAANPNLAQIVKIASEMPCDSFSVKRDGKTIMTINLKKDSTWKFDIDDRLNGKTQILPTELSGEMTENRTIELINNGYDKSAGQVFGKFNFNKQQIIYITTANLENAVMKTIDPLLNPKPKAAAAK